MNWSVHATNAVVMAALGLVATEASALALEHQHHLGVSGGVSILDIEDKSTDSIGVGGGVHYAYGLSDAFNLMGEVSSSIVAANQVQDRPDSPLTRPAGVDTLGIGVGYVLDVLHWVPYVGLLASGAVMNGGTMIRPRVLLGGQLAAGLDYMVTGNLAVGFAYRQHLFVSDLDTYPSFSQFFLRAELVWGR